MNLLLSVANAALAYRRGRQTGLAGLFGIGIAFLIVWQWNNILPVLDALGVVSFFENLGLVYEGEPGLTGYAIFMSFVRLSILIAVVVSILLVIGILISMIFTSDFIFKNILVPLMMILLFPVIVVTVLYQVLFNRKKLVERAEEQRKLGTPMEQLLREHSKQISKEQAFLRLNRLPTIGDNFLFGAIDKTRTEEQKLYILFPRPLYTESFHYTPGDPYSTGYGQGELNGVPITVEEYKEFKHKSEYPHGDVIPTKFHIKKGETVKFKFEDLGNFFEAKHHDLEFIINNLKTEYGQYLEKVQKEYFFQKEAVLNNMYSSKDDEEKFNYWVEWAKKFDAPNEEIVKIMRDSVNNQMSL